MKADSGSWLYIILSIVFLALSAFGNKNKKKATTSTPPLNDEEFETVSPPQTHSRPSGRDWPKSLEDVLNEVLDVPQKPEVVFERSQPVPHETAQHSRQSSYERFEEEAQSLETISEEVSSKKEYFTYEKLSDNNKKMKVEEAPVANARNDERELVISSGDFDLRQGIIYAEILNRKYF